MKKAQLILMLSIHLIALIPSFNVVDCQRRNVDLEESDDMIDFLNFGKPENQEDDQESSRGIPDEMISSSAQLDEEESETDLYNENQPRQRNGPKDRQKTQNNKGGDRWTQLSNQIQRQNQRLAALEQEKMGQKNEIATLMNKDQAKERMLQEAKDEIERLKHKVNRLEVEEMTRMQAHQRQSEQQGPLMTDPPSSCKDLSIYGHDANGFYLIRGKNIFSNKLEAVFCNFKKLTRSDQDGGEPTGKRAGFVAVKSFATGVHFNVQRNSPIFKSNTVVNYQINQMNDGRAINLNTGIFAAPVNGTYQFSFTSVKGDSVYPLEFHFRLNGAKIGGSSGVTTAHNSTVSLQTTIKLKAGDRVDVYKEGNGTMYDDGKQNTKFTGSLLEEDLVL